MFGEGGLAAAAALAVLPAGSVKDETTFFILIGLLAALIGVALYMRHKRNSEPDYDPATE
ncbi:hypothetical protein NTE_02051 [Candidatus Nitrososphaera evergladensis SR1]|jgi:LPXTG-motif cell wall-anchored protein|uniref:Gram-positive cocci surface proteins LPxTG domain-containing protein n=1 Tax=Candidatus Nitrososphaera evergladensis SR1 TaxID=1459636 RepID=A0A075MSH2_9ARCH|nr:LPXTG cell wall anchor domain-containing protein [Candidatus Nitrososphaera evergladensis]AIF84108.1 hypothetical protein NTE_02051 [Candidatus Nitrososphaera evergladensis SR1]